MNTFDDLAKLDEIMPGVSAAYMSLRSREGRGLYTSRGRFFNKAIFGRDAAMSAKFVADFDHEATVETIKQLIAFQGVNYNPKTQEQPGRIHHEWRDFRLWQGKLFDRLPFYALRNKWDIRRHELLSYYSLDTTAAFVRMVHKYALRIDRSILERKVKDKNGETITVGLAVERAADWIEAHIDDNGWLTDRRQRTFSLPIQTFQDSLYTRSDGSLIDLTGPVAYIEVQAYAADSLHSAAEMLLHHDKSELWRATAEKLHRQMITDFRLADGGYGSVIDKDGLADGPNVSMGWMMNIFLWRGMTDDEREHYIKPIVEKLFSDEFLTNVGLRTRAKSAASPLKDAIDYHGSETVWPMFSFMVVEGLRRHRMYDLAEQLENRIINGLNASGNFEEFHVVRRSGELILPGKSSRSISIQMKPEQMIGFSVVPSLVMARRAINPPQRKHQAEWQSRLEKDILSRISHVERVESSLARESVGVVKQRRFRRWSAGLKTSWYFWQQRSRVSLKKER